MKKKWIAVAISGVMALALAGCSTELSNEYITIKKYKGLEIPKVEKTEVTDEIVESTIHNYLAGAEEREEITDRAAEMGDTVDLDYVGTVDGTGFTDGSATNLMLKLGSGRFPDGDGGYEGFEEQIVGHRAGETFDISIKFPADFPNEEVSDRVADYHVTVNGIYKVTTPEFTDEWVKDNSNESKNVEEFKEEIRGKIEESNDLQVNAALHSSVLEALLEQVEIKELPKEQLEEEAQKIEDRYKSIAAGYGLELEEFLSGYTDMTQETFEEKKQKDSEDTVKLELACRLLAEKKRLEPSEKEYEEKIKEYAEDANYEDAEEYKDLVGEDFLKRVILQEKVADYLVEKSVQVEQSDSGEADQEEDQAEDEAETKEE